MPGLGWWIRRGSSQRRLQRWGVRSLSHEKQPDTRQRYPIDRRYHGSCLGDSLKLEIVGSDAEALSKDGFSLLMSQIAPSPMSLMAHSMFHANPGYRSPNWAIWNRCRVQFFTWEQMEREHFIKPTLKGKGCVVPCHRQNFWDKIPVVYCLVRKMNDTRSEKLGQEQYYITPNIW